MDKYIDKNYCTVSAKNLVPKINLYSVGFMEHSGVNPSAAGGCKVEDPTGPPTRSQVDVTELCQRIPFGLLRASQPRIEVNSKNYTNAL